MNRWEKIYSNLPWYLQNIAVTLEGYRINYSRYDHRFLRFYNKFKRNENLNKEELKTYREERLSSFLEHAYTHSSFWEKQIDQSRLNINGKVFNEIRKLPLLTKDLVKKNVDEIKIDNNYDLQKVKTSGTTGGGLVFFCTKDAERQQFAIWWRYRKWHGIDFDEWCGYFGGKKIVPFSQKESPFWRYNFAGKQIMFSAYHINERNIPLYLNLLKEKKIKWIHGYPSLISIFANYILEHEVTPLTNVEIITTGAENLMPYQKNAIEKAFNVSVREHYGQAEGVANVSECEYGTLHVDEDYSFVEFIPIEGFDNQYKIIGTNWTNKAFPLFRYDTGDVATINNSATCSCGRHGRIIEKIDGRNEDYIILPNGEKIGRLDHIFKDLTFIKEAQIVQETKEQVLLRIVKGQEYEKSSGEDKLLSNCRNFLGPDINIDVTYMESIPRTSTGKLRFVVSKMKGNE